MIRHKLSPVAPAMLISTLLLLITAACDLDARSEPQPDPSSGMEGAVGDDLNSESSELPDDVLPVAPQTSGSGGSGLDGLAAGPVYRGSAYYEQMSIEERVDAARIVAEVRIEGIGEPRYNTHDGLAPAGQPNLDDDGWILTQPITMSVLTAYKSDIPSVAGLITFDWAADSALASYSLHEAFAYELGQEGIVMIGDFDPMVETTQIVTHLRQLEQTVPGNLQPAFAGSVLDWFAFEGGIAEGSMFDLESMPVQDLIDQIESHLGP